MATERVQKILAQVGIASRRKAEELIEEGLVTINGKLAKLGDKADLQTDAIKVKGKLLQKNKEAPIYLAFNKPRAVISMLADPEGRPTLADFLGKVKARVFPIGRLDFMSEGLILLTNDGAFAEKLQKMEGVPRVYHVKVRGRPEPEMIAKLEKGARVGNRLVKPVSVRMSEELANKIRVEVVFTDPGAIDVKGLFEFRGFLVESIRRTAIGQVSIRGMLPGEFRYLKPSQVEAILSHPELGLRNIPERGRPLPEGRGFMYRRPEGSPQELRGRSQEKAEPRLPKPRKEGLRDSEAPAKLPVPRGAKGFGKPSGARFSRSARDSGDSRDSRSARDSRGPRPTRDFRSSDRDSRDSRPGRDSRSERGPRESGFSAGKREVRDFRSTRDRDSRGPRPSGPPKPRGKSGIRVTRKPTSR